MPNRFVNLGCALLLALVIPAAGQAQQGTKAPGKAATAGKYNPPRLPDGHPNLSGTYDAATLTPLERMQGTPLVMTKEEAVKQEGIAVSLKQEGDKSVEANRAAPPKGGDGSPGPAGNVGGYNSGWLDPGSTFNVVDGQIRASIVIDPPNGRVPPVVSGAQRGAAGFVAPNGVGLLKYLLTTRPRSDATESGDPGLETAPGAYDDPERRPLGERCLLGFGSTSGPPMLPNYFYNNLHQIVQTPDAVMILTEMVHDVRVVRMNAQHLPKNIRQWLGDSVGHWEGDTLVVDTTNFTDKTNFHGATEDMHVIERFTRMDAHTLLYRFTIDDPKTWTKPWTGEYSWPEAHGNIYEYACHEGNYALKDILKGARERDKEEAAKTGAK